MGTSQTSLIVQFYDETNLIKKWNHYNRNFKNFKNFKTVTFQNVQKYIFCKYFSQFRSSFRCLVPVV